MGYSLVAEKFMKGNAGGIRVGNAGAEIADVLPAEDVLQRQIKLFSDSLFPKALLYVNRGFHRPVVGSPALKGGNIGISQSFSIFLCHKVGVFFKVVRMRVSNSDTEGTSYSKVIEVFST